MIEVPVLKDFMFSNPSSSLVTMMFGYHEPNSAKKIPITWWNLPGERTDLYPWWCSDFGNRAAFRGEFGWSLGLGSGSTLEWGCERTVFFVFFFWRSQTFQPRKDKPRFLKSLWGWRCRCVFFCFVCILLLEPIGWGWQWSGIEIDVFASGPGEASCHSPHRCGLRCICKRGGS